MNMITDFIPLGCPNRTGRKIKQVKGVVIHYVGCDQPNASVFAKSWKTKTVYGATTYVVDWNNGDIYYVIPENEVAFHVGAKKYTDLTKLLIGNDNPNNYFIGIECCIPSVENSKPSDIQWKSLVELSVDILKRNKLTQDNLYLHYDITGKNCHKYFTENPTEWIRFKEDVRKSLVRANANDVVITPKPIENVKSVEVKPTQIEQWLSVETKKFILDNKIATDVENISNEKQMAMQMICNYDKYLDVKINDLLKTIKVIYGA